MATRNIVKDGDSILRKSCRKVERFDKRLWELLDDMAETLYEANGVGLAAPQVGVRRQVVVVDVDDELIELMNPEIIWQSDETAEDIEGCLSFPGQWGLVERPVHVKVKAQDRNGDEFEVEGSDLLARCLCHEIDHLNGTVFVDKVKHMLTEEEIADLSQSKREEEQAEGEEDE